MRALPLAALAALLLAAPALAAPPVRVTGTLNVRSGPGHDYGVIGQLPKGSQIELDYCTRNDRWCLVKDYGWVDASYLVGWSAKMQVTPPNFAGPGW